MIKKKNFEELGLEPGPPRPERKKIAWPFMLSANLYRAIRQKAAVDGATLSETVSRLMSAADGKVPFPPLPAGASMRMTGNGTSKPTRYFIPIDVAEHVQEAQERGYSNAFICAKLIEKGLELVLNQGPQGSSDLRPGPLEGSPKGGDVEKEPEIDDIPSVETSSTPTV